MVSIGLAKRGRGGRERERDGKGKGSPGEHRSEARWDGGSERPCSSTSLLRQARWSRCCFPLLQTQTLWLVSKTIPSRPSLASFLLPNSLSLSLSVGVGEEGLPLQQAHFRGRLLQGTTLPLPHGYSGILFCFHFTLERSSSSPIDAYGYLRAQRE